MMCSQLLPILCLQNVSHSIIINVLDRERTMITITQFVSYQPPPENNLLEDRLPELEWCVLRVSTLSKLPIH